MAANTNLLGDKETNNWFKACIGLNITKEGLTNFLCTELQKVHAVVGRSCGNCPIEKLIQCPTNPYCNKRKRNYCPFHKSRKPQPCAICDNVKHNIILQHRYGGPSWRNTCAENWALNYWEIGKCYLPPDGYSSISSVQESDFNGVISIMLNCLHFQTCLSSSWVLPPPPDKQCPLEKVRQIGRDVRHTSDCKVTDADLQDYFKTLSTLLADPQYLQHDPSAAIAFARLRDVSQRDMFIYIYKLKMVQNDCISIEELGDLLKEVYDSLKHAQEVVERFSEEAERTLSNAFQKLDATILFGKKRLERKTQVGEQRLKIKTNVGKQCLERKTKFGEQHLERKTKDGEQFIESKVQDGIVRLEQTAHKTAQAAYERAVADLRRRLVDHYHDNASNVPLSVLDQSLDKRIADIYATPKIHRIEITKDGKRVKKEQVLAYKELFCSDDSKSNRRLYVQGEPGSGKSTFAAKLVHVWCDGYRPSTAAPNVNESFDDVLIIQKFQFVFYIALRESRGTKDLTHMVKKQLIDTLYSDEKRDEMYKLLLQIIEPEVCLVVRDGLDEWVAPDGSNLAEPSMAGFPNDKCTVLTTSRPWKLAEERIKNSQIDILVEIEGINDPNTFCERVLRCILDESKNLKTTAFEIRRFISDRKLTSLSYSPMLYTLIICTWTDTLEDMEHLKGFSLCALYTSLLESLCKKTSDIIGFFNDLNPPQVKCFSRSRYLRPIIQKVDVISKAAFHLLFSPEKEQSIVFNDHELSNYLTQSEQEFALKAGLISKRKTKKTFNSSISFLHKSIQEFLAAYHIALNAHLIDDVIFGYLGRHSNAYLDISQVFIFLCGLNISAANKLSCMMNEQSCIMNEQYGNMNEHNNNWHNYRTFQSIIEAGYTEAVSNDQTDILLQLSRMNIHENNLMAMYNIWRENKSNVLDLNIYVGNKIYRDIQRSSTLSEATSQVEFDLSSCIKLKYLTLSGSIQIKDSSSSVSSTLPVCIVLHSANPAQCADPPPLLSCIKRIELENITCSSNLLRSLLSTLLTLDNGVRCKLTECYITSCKSDAVPWADTATDVRLTCFKNTLELKNDGSVSRGLWEAFHGLNIKSLNLSCDYLGLNVNYKDSMSQSTSSLTHQDTLRVNVAVDSPGLWEALRGLNIKSLSLNGGRGGLNVNNADSMSQSLSSLTQLNTLNIKVNNDSPGLWDALRGLNIKSLSLSGGYVGINVNYAESMSQSLSSLTQLNTLNIKVVYDSCGLWDALRGLNINNLSLNGGLRVNYADSMSQSLSSLTHLDTLSIEVQDDSPGLWEVLRGLNIKSLSLSGFDYRDLTVTYADSMSQSLSSLTHLDTLSIKVNDDSPGLWKALRGLNIKNLSLMMSGRYGGSNVDYADSMSQSLSSLTHLDTLSIKVNDFSVGRYEALRGLNIKSLSLSGSHSRWLLEKHIDAMSQSLSSLTHLDTLSIEVGNIPYRWDALRGLNIKSLILSGRYKGLDVNYADSMSNSLTSLSQLDTLSIKVNVDSPGLWEALRGLNIKSLSLSGWYRGLAVNYADSMSNSLKSLSQLETLSIKVDVDSPGLWEALRGLNIKSLSLSGGYEGINVTYADSMSQSLSSLTQLDTLSIELDDYSPFLWKALHELNIKSLSVSGGYEGSNVKYADSMSQLLLTLNHLDTLSIAVDDYSPYLWQALFGLNIKSLSLRGKYEGFSVCYADLMSQSLSSLTHLDTLSIEVDNDSPGLWEVLRGLNIKSLSLSGSDYRGLNVTYADLMSQSLSSLTHLDTLSIEVNNDSPGLWKGLYGLNIKSLSLCVAYEGLNIYDDDDDYANLMSLPLSSLTHLDTLSISAKSESPGLWKALHGLNINSLSIRVRFLTVSHADSIAQSLSSLKQLETFSIYFYSIYFDIKLPQSLKHLNSYCMILLPSELRELVDALSACTQTIESNLDFCCASMDDSTLKRIPPEEYIVVKKELEMRKNVAVKRFRILDRIHETKWWSFNHDDDDATSHWSVRDMCGVHYDNPDDDIVNVGAYKRFVLAISNEIINRISMRLLITPSSNS